MRILSDNEVGKREIAQCKLVLSYKFVEGLQLRPVLLDNRSLSCFVVLVEVKSLNRSCNLREDGKEAFEMGVVLQALAQEFLVSPLLDDVALDGVGFGDVVLSIKQVRQIGEIDAQVDLVLLEPVIRIGVVIVLECDVGESEQQSWHLAESANRPVSQLHSVIGWLDRHHRGHKRRRDCVRPVVVSPHAGQLFKIPADSPPETVVVPLSWEDSLEVVKIL